MDPQGRILLEQCSLALRDAEARSEHLAGRETGVYVGVMHMEYIQYMTGEVFFHSTISASTFPCMRLLRCWHIRAPLLPMTSTEYSILLSKNGG